MIEWKGPTIAGLYPGVDHRDVLMRITFPEDGAANFTFVAVLDGYRSANVCLRQFTGIAPTSHIGGIQCTFTQPISEIGNAKLAEDSL